MKKLAIVVQSVGLQTRPFTPWSVHPDGIVKFWAGAMVVLQMPIDRRLPLRRRFCLACLAWTRGVDPRRYSDVHIVMTRLLQPHLKMVDGGVTGGIAA